MSKILNVDVVKEVGKDKYELAPVEINVDSIVGIRDWSGEMDEGLESYGIDYTGSVTEITVSGAINIKYLAAVTFQFVCDTLKEEKDSLLAALVLYVGKRRQEESCDDREGEASEDYDYGFHDGTITTLNDICDILKNFGK